MPSIKEGKRIAKRVLLTNLLTSDYNLAVTPLLSGKHGIGKSQVAKQIAKELKGVCLTIEGGTLKEGEITGIPYQYKDENGEIEFKFLPYYIVERIQKAEKKINNDIKKNDDLLAILEGTDNKYSNNDLTFEQKIKLLKSGVVKPVVIFFDEINRTDNAVFRELMNIILNKTINGYQLPWWVFIIAAMNPSTQNSIYATNEMDPAQLDRFIKLKVREDANDWIDFALENDVEKTIVEFISGHQDCLAKVSSELEDEDVPSPSPRGWNMVDLIIKGKDKLDDFFSKDELSYLEDDIRLIINAKVGTEVSTMYYASLKDKSKVVTAKDIFNTKDEDISDELKEIIKEQSTARNSITTKDIIVFLKRNIDDLKTDKQEMKKIKKKLSSYLKLLDNSSKLLFAQTIVDTRSKEDTLIFDLIFEIFDQDIMDLLESSNMDAAKITRKNDK